MKFQEILTTEHYEELQERAGIMEYDGNIPRKYAEEKAAELLSNKYTLYNQPDWFGKSNQQWGE